MGIGNLCRMPPAAVLLGEPDKVQGRDPVGIVEGSCWYRAHGVSNQGKFVLSRNPRYKTRVGRHVPKHSSDPRVAYSEVESSGMGPNVSCGYC